MIILDADGLIKLHRAGVLDLVAQSYERAILSRVYEEAVVNAKGKHPDAQQIDEVIQASMMAVAFRAPMNLPVNIGAGERQVLAPFLESVSAYNHY